MRRATALAATAMTAALLVGCTGGDDGTSAPTAGSSATPGPSTASPGDDAPVAGEAVPGCVAGTWRLDLAAMQDDLRRLLAATGDDEASVDVVVEGSSTWDLAPDGAFRADVDSTSSLTVAADGTELTSSSRSTGDLTGRWELAGDRLTISEVDSSGLDVTTTGTLDGEDLDVPDGSAEDAIEALPPTVSTVTCSASTLTLVSSLQEDESSEPVPITYTLRR